MSPVGLTPIWTVEDSGGLCAHRVCSGTRYGIPAGIFYSFPCTCAGGEWSIVDGLAIDAFSKQKMEETADELSEELSLALSLL